MARGLVLCLMLDDLAKEKHGAKREELLVLLTFVYFGTALPRWIYDTLVAYTNRAMQDLQGESLPLWHYVFKTSTKAMLNSLKYWLNAFANKCDIETALATVLTPAQQAAQQQNFYDQQGSDLDLIKNAAKNPLPSLNSIPPEAKEMLVAMLLQKIPGATREKVESIINMRMANPEHEEARQRQSRHPWGTDNDCKLFSETATFGLPITFLDRETKTMRDAFLALVHPRSPEGRRASKQIGKEGDAMRAIRKGIRSHWQGNFTHRDEQCDNEEGS